MGIRGKKSSAELATVGGSGVSFTRRPEPPAHLGDEASRLWRTICNSLPADAFHAGALPVFEAYCGLAVSLARTLRALDRIERQAGAGFDAEEWRKLQRQAGELGQRVTMMATRLRFTPQSMVHPATAGRRALTAAAPSVYDTVFGDDNG